MFGCLFASRTAHGLEKVRDWELAGLGRGLLHISVQVGGAHADACGRRLAVAVAVADVTAGTGGGGNADAHGTELGLLLQLVEHVRAAGGAVQLAERLVVSKLGVGLGVGLLGRGVQGRSEERRVGKECVYCVCFAPDRCNSSNVVKEPNERNDSVHNFAVHAHSSKKVL